jgi:hypothetical protein
MTADEGNAERWSVEELLRQPEVQSVLKTGQPARVTIAFHQSRLTALVSRRHHAADDGTGNGSGSASGSALQIGPVWVISVEGLPEIDPALRMMPFVSMVEIGGNQSDDDTDVVEPSWATESLIASAFPSTIPAGEGEPPCPAPASIDDPNFKFVLAWDDRTTANKHAQAVEGLALARSIVELLSREGTDESDIEIERARLLGAAEGWLREFLPPMPACGSPLVAFVELVDARQAVLRSLGRVSDADNLWKWNIERLGRAGLHALCARLSERVPHGSTGFASATFHACWLTDTGEITAAASHIVQRQRRFADDLISECRNLKPCDDKLIEALKQQSEWLIGRLPEGARVDDAVKDMLRSRIDDFCRMTPPIPPVLVRDFAMTCALQAWTAAWTAEGARDPASADAHRLWEKLIVSTIGDTLNGEIALSKIPPAEVPFILEELSSIVAPMLAQRVEYLSAFPPGEKTTEMFRKNLGWIHAREGNMGRYYRQYEDTVEDYSKMEPHPGRLESALQHARNCTASTLAIDALQAMFEALAESGPTKNYPEPFPMRPSGLKAGLRGYNWRIGLD